ncbi:MAG TPA: DegV family protein [Gaiellaceae bacterium]|nr:DegV family protein [Gaiellaceae bacterium]
MELTAENTAIVVDSTADFPDAAARFPNWRVVPLYVLFGDESYRDYVELPAADFYQRLRTSPVMPTTSQPTPGDFAAAYGELTDFERVYSLHLSAKFSGTWESAKLGAGDQLGGRIRIVDTESASLGITLLGLGMQRRLERGTTDGELEALVETFKKEVGLVFTVDTLEFLARGGRIGRAQAWAGQLLSIKPILTIAEGEIVPVKRVRGNRKAFAEFQRGFEERTVDRPSLRVAIAHADAPEREQALRRMVRDTRPSAQIDAAGTLGPVVGTHAGPGAVGFFFWDDA